MKIIGKVIIPLFLAVFLTACNGVASTPATSPTDVTGTAISIAKTDVVMTLTAVPPATWITQTPSPKPPSAEPETTLTPSITEEASFWENMGSVPSNISITEYALPPDKNPTEDDGLFQFVPTQVWTVGKADTSPTPHKTTLKDIGYELRTVYTAGGLPYCQQLYRDNRLLFDCDVEVSNIYTVPTDSDPITAFIVEVDLGNENFVIQNDAINTLGGYAIYTSAPVLYQGELLWARMYSDRIEIKKSNGDIIFTFTTNWGPNHYPMFRAWNGHWILEANSSVIQDGEILNQKLGSQEIFKWGLVKGKPIYFFRKGSRIGLSYDGKNFPTNYKNVAHDLCCGPGQNNPSMGNDVVHFFGERNGLWYYVVMEFK
jgi:hypothetical protein